MNDLSNFVPFVLLPLIYWGARRRLRQRNDYPRLKQITLGIGMTAWFLTEMGRSFYRPYIYANGIDDWVIADTLGNTLGTITAIFMILTLSGRGTAWDWRLVALVISGLLAYEFTNLTGHHPFDRNDVVATLLSGLVAVLLYGRLLTRYTGK